MLCHRRQNHIDRFALVSNPDAGKGERLVRVEDDPIRLLAESSRLSFIEPIRNDQATALSECIPESRQPVDGFHPRVDQHATG